MTETLTMKENKLCEYQLPNCQKQAINQHILKLGVVQIDKGWICANCQQEIEKQRNQTE